jgi:hypothetical protein
MRELAGEGADGGLRSWTAAHYLPQAIQLVRDGAKKAGRDSSEVEISGYLRVAVTDDIAAGRAGLQQQIARYSSSTHYQNFFRSTGFEAEMVGAERARDHSDNQAMAAAIGENMQEEIGVVGPADVCLARIEELRNMGLTKLIVAPIAIGDLKESYESTIRANYAYFFLHVLTDCGGHGLIVGMVPSPLSAHHLGLEPGAAKEVLVVGTAGVACNLLLQTGPTSRDIIGHCNTKVARNLDF